MQLNKKITNYGYFRDTLSGPNIFLRRPHAKDWKEWAELRSDSQSFLRPWEPAWTPRALSRSEFRQRIRQQRRLIDSKQAYPFFIFRKKDNCILGGITISNIQRGVSKSGTIGYWIGEKHSRHGYMKEGLSCVLSFSFSELELHRVQAFCMTKNISSKNLLENLGFRLEGEIRDCLYINDLWEDHLLYNILSTDWSLMLKKGSANVL